MVPRIDKIPTNKTIRILYHKILDNSQKQKTQEPQKAEWILLQTFRVAWIVIQSNENQNIPNSA